MRLTRYLLLSIAGIMLIAVASLMLFAYQGTKSDTYDQLYRESEAIYNFLMSVRRVYQKQFLESEIALNDKTVGFLPAHSMPRISKEFSENWDRRGIRVNTASDRPRNPDNMADAGELEAMSWFRQDDERQVFTKEENGSFLYVRPVWVVKSCLKCHGAPEEAPPSIRDRYEGAYGYEIGDLRGVFSIRIPIERMDATVMSNFTPRLLVLLAAFMLIAVAVYGVVRRLLSRPLCKMADEVRKIGEKNHHAYRLSPQSGELGEFVERFNIMMDRQYQLRSALSEQKEKMEQILESMEEGVIVTDQQGHILRINKKLEQLTGWPTITHFGASIDSLFAEQQKDDSRQQRKLNCSDGTQIPVHVSIGELQQSAEEGNQEGQVLVVHDLRAQQRAEQQEAFAAYQAGIAEMSTMILHNVGNALTAIDGGILRLKRQIAVVRQFELLFDKVIDTITVDSEGENSEIEACNRALAEGQELLERSKQEVLVPLLQEIEEESVGPIEHSVRHIGEIIRAQQGSVKLETQFTLFELSGAVEDALVMQRDMLDKLGIEVVKQVAEDVEVCMPRNQLIQVLNNLIKNGYESIIERKQQAPTYAGRLELVVQQSEGHSQLRVIDNGIGVEPERLSELSDFGYTSKRRGSGFGLHASVNFINEIGGTLEFDSEGVGKGAVVTITIPEGLKERA